MLTGLHYCPTSVTAAEWILIPPNTTQDSPMSLYLWPCSVYLLYNHQRTTGIRNLAEFNKQKHKDLLHNALCNLHYHRGQRNNRYFIIFSASGKVACVLKMDALACVSAALHERTSVLSDTRGTGTIHTSYIRNNPVCVS